MLIACLILATVAAIGLMLRAAIRHDRARATRSARRVIFNDGFGPTA